MKAWFPKTIPGIILHLAYTLALAIVIDRWFL